MLFLGVIGKRGWGNSVSVCVEQSQRNLRPKDDQDQEKRLCVIIVLIFNSLIISNLNVLVTAMRSNSSSSLQYTRSILKREVKSYHTIIIITILIIAIFIISATDKAYLEVGGMEDGRTPISGSGGEASVSTELPNIEGRPSKTI